jgi:MoaE-MoaD fusion protein
MTVNVRLFASLRELIGEPTISVDLPDGATVEALRARVGETYPNVQPFLNSIVCAVDEEYVPASHVLRDGDNVALIPPVSGGA